MFRDLETYLNTIQGIEAELVLLDDIVQDVYGENRRQQLQLYRQSPSRFLSGLSVAIERKIQNCDGRVPIITGTKDIGPMRLIQANKWIGFFGAMPDSLISTVGRGYSDLCAALCAASVDAMELQIWKEVDVRKWITFLSYITDVITQGIFTADPSKVKSARLLATVTSEEAAELTYYGSEV